MENITVKEFLDTCETGDYLLYNSNAIISRFIEYMSGSRYSHIAMILKDPVWIDETLRGIYIFESGIENVPDAETGKKVFGVQIVPIEYVLNQYKNARVGNLYYSKVECERDETFYNKLKEIISCVENKKYDLNPCDWIKAKFDIEVGNIHRTDKFWCSALMSYVYSQLGFLDADIPWTIIAPRRFSYYENEKLSFQKCQVNAEKCICFTSN